MSLWIMIIGVAVVSVASVSVAMVVQKIRYAESNKYKIVTFIDRNSEK